MNAEDLARIELAKRAYQAAQPREAEVQRGVRRTRLALSRTSRRRNWFSKGLVFVVLAVGGLAYAKPQALGELVEKMSPASTDSPGKGGRRALTSAPEAEELTAASDGARSSAKPKPVHVERAGADAEGARAASDSLAAPAELTPPVDARRDGVISAPVGERALPAAAPQAISQPRGSAKSKSTQDSSPKLLERDPATEATTASLAPSGSSNEQALSDWGRVGQALAHGDDATALSALQQLAQSEDARTRDKADLGRAQLLIASGSLEQGCSLARSLTHRRAGGRIERQALLLLKRCSE